MSNNTTKKKYIIITTGTMVGYMAFYIVLMALISHWLTINNQEETKATNNMLYQKTVKALNKLKTTKQSK
jgi:hypothetical protein